MTPRVSIVIPTFRRTHGAIAAARSALAQECKAPFEIILVDNDPAGGALDDLHALADHASHSMTVVHEARPGVATARNAGLRAAKGKLIAFLDDDEIASDRWLAELVRVQAETKADVVFGPVSTRLTSQPRNHRDYFHDFFARDPHHREGPIKVYYGCGCSLVRRDALPCGEPFSAARNEIGGEDELLFQIMKARGATFAWAPSAYVWETPEPSRVTLAYTLKQAFALGQGPAIRAWTGKPKKLGVIIWSMIAGFAQAIVYGAAALGCFLARTERRAFAYRRFVEGVGRLLWFPAIKPRFHGAARLPKVERKAAAKVATA
jgi:glycosyltransferase involved in cell wall biosynthesis